MIDTWCVIKIDRQEFKARVKHKGRGKFAVIESEGDSQRKVVDASDIVYCLDPNLAKTRAITIIKETHAIMEGFFRGSIDKTKAKNDLTKLIDEI